MIFFIACHCGCFGSKEFVIDALLSYVVCTSSFDHLSSKCLAVATVDAEPRGTHGATEYGFQSGTNTGIVIIIWTGFTMNGRENGT